MDPAYLREEILEKGKKYINLGNSLSFDEVIEFMRMKFDFRYNIALKYKEPMVFMRINSSSNAELTWLKWMADESSNWDVFTVTGAQGKDDNSGKMDYRFKRIVADSVNKDAGDTWFIRKGLTKEEISRLFWGVKEVTM